MWDRGVTQNLIFGFSICLPWRNEYKQLFVVEFLPKYLAYCKGNAKFLKNLQICQKFDWKKLEKSHVSEYSFHLTSQVYPEILFRVPDISLIRLNSTEKGHFMFEKICPPYICIVLNCECFWVWSGNINQDFFSQIGASNSVDLTTMGNTRR